MDLTGTTNDFSKQGQDLADKAANKIQGGIQDAKRTVNLSHDLPLAKLNPQAST